MTETKTKTVNRGKYSEHIGRRKTATARVRLYSSDKGITVNEKPLAKYFTPKLAAVVEAPFKFTARPKSAISIKIVGGGITAQAEAARHGLSRALVKLNPEAKILLKQAGWLTRDSRMVERKKPGLKKARRAPQWKKR